jgi:hypothetical protein
VSVLLGFRKLRRMVTHTIARWRHEIPWMSLYFSTAVWTSLTLAASAWCGIFCRAIACGPLPQSRCGVRL